MFFLYWMMELYFQGLVILILRSSPICSTWWKKNSSWIRSFVMAIQKTNVVTHMWNSTPISVNGNLLDVNCVVLLWYRTNHCMWHEYTHFVHRKWIHPALGVYAKNSPSHVNNKETHNYPEMERKHNQTKRNFCCETFFRQWTHSIHPLTISSIHPSIAS